MRIDGMTRVRARNLDVIGARAPGNERFADVLVSARHHEPMPEAAPSTWSAADRAAFEVFVLANRRTESGGEGGFSTLRTTAGAAHRASYGVAQLSVREHLGHLARLDDVTLVALGTDRATLDAMRARGEAAEAFYHLVVDGREREASLSALGASSHAAGLFARAHDGDAGALQALGPLFESSTGLPASALDELAATRALRDPERRLAFLAQYEHDHGVAFDPAHRDPARMSLTAGHVVLADPELARAHRLLGGDAAASTSLAHYLGVGDTAENLFGWHERAAATVRGQDALARLLEAADGTTSAAREAQDFERALAAVSRIHDLEGEARVGTLARLARTFHGSPTRAREALFEGGHLDAPRCTTRAELDATLDALRASRSWSDARLAVQVARVLAERGRVPT